MNIIVKKNFKKKLILSVLFTVVIFSVFYSVIRINNKDEVILQKILPFTLDLRYFNNTQKQYLDVENTFLYTIPEKYKISRFPNSVRVFKNNDKINWVLTVHGSSYKKLFNGQEFDDVIIAENNKDYILINGDYIFYKNKKIINNQHTVYKLHKTGKFAYFTFLNNTSVLNVDDYIIPLEKGIKVKKIFFSEDGQRFSCFVEKDSKNFILLDNKEIIEIEGNLKEFVFSHDNADFVYLLQKDDYESMYLNNLKIGDFVKIKNITFSSDGRFFSFLVRDGSDRGDYHLFLNGDIMYSNIKNTDLIKFSEKGDYIFTSFKFFDDENNSVFSLNGNEIFRGTNFTQLKVEQENRYYSTIFEREGADFLVINGRGLISLPDIRDYCFDDEWKNIAFTGASKTEEKDIFYPFPFKVSIPYDYSVFLNNVSCEDRYDYMGNCIYSSSEDVFYTIGVKEKNVYLIKVKNNERDDNTKYSKNVEFVKELEKIASIDTKFDFKNIEKFKIDYISPDSLEEIQRNNLIAEIHSAANAEKYEIVIELCRKYLNRFGNEEKIIRILYKNLYNYSLFEESLEYVQFLIDIYKDDYELLKIKADILNKLKRTDESLRLLHEISLKFNEPVDILCKLIEIYFEQRNIVLSERFSLKVLKRNKDNFIANLILGKIFFERQIYYKAEDYFMNCLKITEKNSEIFKMLALVKENFGQYKDGIYYINKAIEVNRKSAELINIRADLYYKDNNITKAVEDMEFVVKYDYSEENILKLSDYLFESKKYKKVFNVLSLALAEKTESSQIYNQYATFLLTAEDSSVRDGEKAIIYARTAYKLNPILQIKDTLATAYAEAGFFKDAVILQKEIVKESELKIYKEKLDVFKSGMTWFEHLNSQ